MVRRASRTDLLAGIALFSGLAIFGDAQAKAESVCTLDTSTFNCIDDSPAGTPTGSGTFSAGTLAMPSVYGELAIVHSGDLDLVLETGELTSSSDGVVFAFAGGHLSYNSNGITTSSGVDWLTNTILNAASIEADTGTVYASARGAAGVHSAATNGSNLTTGGTTVVSGQQSRGLVTQATNGDNVTNTGTITASGFNSKGVIARTILGTTCGTNTVNVTGNVSVDTHAVSAISCGVGTVNVLAGNTVTSATTGAGWGTIVNSAATVAATTIDGTVAASAPDLEALYLSGGSSATQVGSTGTLTGTFSGTDGIDTFSIAAGGAWNTAGTSSFNAGADQLTNAGTIFASGNTSLSGLEVFAHSGTISMANGSISDTLFIEGAYVGGSGASLHIDASDMGADRLTIGGHASGTTSLFVTTGVLIPDPVLVVDTGSTDASAFVLGNTSATPLIDLNLTQTGDDYFVTAVPSATAQQTTEIAGATLRRWQQSADDLLAGGALKRPARNRDRRTPLAFWTRSYADTGVHVGRGGSNLTGGGTAVQAGIDYLVADKVAVGLVGGYDNRETDVSTKVGGFQAGGSHLGAYIQYAPDSGFYAGVLAMADRRNMRLTHGAFAGADGNPDARTIGAEAHTGFRMTAMGVGIDAGGGLAYVSSQVGDFTVAGMGFDFGKAKSLRGRLGLRGEFDGRLGFFADAKLYLELDGRNAMTVSTGAQSYAVEAAGQTTWARFEAGFGHGELEPALSAWAVLGTEKGLGMKAAMRF